MSDKTAAVGAERVGMRTKSREKTIDSTKEKLEEKTEKTSDGEDRRRMRNRRIPEGADKEKGWEEGERHRS